MSEVTEELDWGTAKALFDANFVFRKSEAEPGDRWYRKDANGAYIWLKENEGVLLIGLESSLDPLPDGVSEADASPFLTPNLYCYRINSMAGLEQVVSAFLTLPAENVSLAE